MSRLYYVLRDAHARFWTKYRAEVSFVHINKTGGTSIEKALGLPFLHMTAVQLRALIGEVRWKRRFSFAFVRNPWDKVASHYRFRVKTNQTGLGDDPIPFSQWVRRAYGDRDPTYYDNPQMFMQQIEWVADEQGKILVDFIGRFERLHDDFDEVCRRIGRSATLPHVKSTGSRDYRPLYDDRSVEIITERFADDVERFRYSFERERDG